MEQMAKNLSKDAEQWEVMGLLSQLDLEAAENNPKNLGKIARQQAELEGLSPTLGKHLENWRHPVDKEPTALEDALYLASTLSESTLEDRGQILAEAEDSIIESVFINQRQKKAIERLGLQIEQVKDLALSALENVAQDLK